ncbi:MAG: methionyl-tRNA synthetase [Patescibacteria group bacterium]|jgi:methionyl-tRNA synthetase
MAKEKFYVTTAIDYVNAEPHIGHTYQKVVADVIARWQKLLGKDVYFLTGTDEHGQKVEESAKKNNKDPQKFVDETSQKFKDAWKSLNIQYDRFIRTTDEDHRKLVVEFIEKCNKNGDIYKGNYEGNYCVGCEEYKTQKDLEDGNCLIHKKPVEHVKEESYFFKLSKYQDFLLDLYENNPETLQPESRRNEIINRLKEGLNDLSITRTSFKWGIPFPLEPKTHITYVWFDALINYLTGAGEKQSHWPADIHLLGKDNTWFHSVYWPAMLKSAGYPLFKTVFSHGFLTVDGEKISKSLGNAISPIDLVEKYGADSVRYFCLRSTAFGTGNDGDFSEAALIERHNNELTNKLGNLVSRTAGLIEKNGLEQTQQTLNIEFAKIDNLIQTYQFDKALNEIFAFIDTCNEYIQEQKPWETKDKKVLYQLADAIKQIAIVISPFIPETAEQIAKKLGIKLTLKELETPLNPKSKITKGNNIFGRVESIKKETPQGKTMTDTAQPVTKMPEGITIISFEDFTKVDLRVGEIEKAEHIEDSHKLFKLTVNLGHEERTIVSGIREWYTKEDLQGMKVTVITNLKPRKMRGVESQGMLLAAQSPDGKKVVLIGPNTADIENGSKIM